MKKLLLAVGFFSLFNFIALFLTSRLYFEHIFLGIGAAACIVYGTVYNKFPRKVHRMILFICLIPVAFAGFLAIYGKTQKADYTEDVVIILGAGLRGDGEVGAHLARRLDVAVTYLNENPDAVAITSGGIDEWHSISEAEAMSRYLQRRGIAPERILLEERSTSTLENLTFSNEILSAYFPNGYRAVIISNYFHIYRATSIAKKIGISANGLGASTPSLSMPANYLREVIAVTYMWFFG